MSKKNKHLKNIHQSFSVNQRVPFHDIDVEGYKDRLFAWSINTKWLCMPDGCGFKKDCDKGCFSLKNLSSNELFKIFQKLDEYRTWHWRDIERSANSTSTGCMDINKLAFKEMIKKHLASKHLEEHDELYKIEISGRHRVWGIRKEDTLFLLWNDAEHRFFKHQDKNYTKPQQ